MWCGEQLTTPPECLAASIPPKTKDCLLGVNQRREPLTCVPSVTQNEQVSGFARYTLGQHTTWVQLADILCGPQGLALALPAPVPHVNTDKHAPDPSENIPEQSASNLGSI